MSDDAVSIWKRLVRLSFRLFPTTADVAGFALLLSIVTAFGLVALMVALVIGEAQG